MLSARNQIEGVVKSVSRGAVNAEVLIITDSGLELASVITLGSCVMMAIEPGMPVTVIIKASAVLLAVGENFMISTRNMITGQVKDILTGKVSDEVVIDANGTELVSIITKKSVERLGLTRGTTVSALIKATDVILMN